MAVPTDRAVSPVIIGRESELEALRQALHAAREGAGRCLLIAGEAGLGKSRLVAELATRAAAEGFLIWQGYCFEEDSSFPYAPWIDALRAFLAPKSPAETGELLESLAFELIKILPELSLLIPGLEPDAPLDAESEKRRLYESIVRFATRLAGMQPLLVVLEDLHWSDATSLELLHLFVRRISALPILLVGTYRNDELSPRLSRYFAELTREHLAQELALNPLTRREAAQLVQAVLRPERGVLPVWLEQFISLTEGNPFFVEEMLKSRLEGGTWDELHIPQSLQDSVQRRVERLPQRTRHLLAIAAVTGERFDFGLLQAISAEDEPSMLQMLKEMIEARLIVEQSADQFAFRHALTRQAVYATLMQRERQALHQMIGETLERSAGARTNATLLAYHFYEGGAWDRALTYSQRAGEEAQALYAPREALTLFGHAIEAARQLGIPAPAAALQGRAQALEVVGEFDGARADYEAILELARRGRDRAKEWQVLLDLGSLWQSRDLKLAGGYFQPALELARELGNPSILGQTLNRVGNWNMNRGRVREALSYHLEALELFRKREDRPDTARTLDLMGVASYSLGEAIQGEAYLEQAVPIWRELGDRQGLVNTLTNLTLLALMDNEVLGSIDYIELTRASDEALQIARGFNWYHGEALALLNAALSLKQAGEFGLALERLAQATPLVDESQNRESLIRLHLTFGQVYILLFASDAARQHIETSLTLLRELGSGLLTLGATAQLASVVLLQNDLVRARALLAPLFPSEYPKGQEPFPLRGCWSAQADLELRAGNAARALEIADRLLAFTPNLEEYGPHAVPRLSRIRALSLAALDRMEEAESELLGALIVAEQQGCRPLLWQLHADLGNIYRAVGRRDDAEREYTSSRTIIQDLGNRTPEGPLRDNFIKQASSFLPPAPALTPRQAAKKAFGGLTAREREIAALVAQGKSNREIAETLVISETTAERHVANILSKLGFNSRTQVAVWAVEKGLSR